MGESNILVFWKWKEDSIHEIDWMWVETMEHLVAWLETEPFKGNVDIMRVIKVLGYEEMHIDTGSEKAQKEFAEWISQ